MKEEANKKVEEEKKKREEAEERISRMEREMEEMKKKEGALHTPPPSNTPPVTPIASNVITSLDGTSIIFPPSTDVIKRKVNTILHHGPDETCRNCFIGGEMTSV